MIDSGAPCSVGGINSAAALCDALGIELSLNPPVEVFEHGYGPQMQGAKLVLCSWQLPVEDISGGSHCFLFHLVEGDDPLLIGEDVARNGKIDNIENLFHLQQPNGDFKTFYTYYDAIECRRRLASIMPASVPTRVSAAYLTASSKVIQEMSPSRLGEKLHRYTHATVEEMVKICKMAGILNEKIRQALQEAFESCEVCCRTGRPKDSKKVSITHLDSAFNASVQVDFFFPYVQDKTITVFHARDRATGYSELEVVPSRDLSAAALAFDRMWMSRHGAPSSVSGDPEFNRSAFKEMLSEHGIQFDARPARRHNKLGSVERKNGVLRPIIQRVSMQSPDLDLHTIVARSNFLGNIFRGSRLVSSFEHVRGYAPSITGLPQSMVTEDMLREHKERVAGQALCRLLSSKVPNVLTQQLVPEGTKIWALLKSGKWEPLVVKQAMKHYVIARRHAKGPPLNVGYEDIRLAPTTEFGRQAMAAELEVAASDKAEAQSSAEEIQKISSLLSRKRSAGVPQRDIGTDVSSVHPIEGSQLQSDEQNFLRAIEDVVGPSQVSASKLNFAPQWVMDKAFEQELRNWNDVYSEFSEVNLPNSANVISSHTVYKVKTDESGAKSLKARIVAHGNEDRDKHTVRKDSAAAQFDVVRILLCVCSIKGLRLGKVDVKRAYLQSGPIRREIFVRPPREWHYFCYRNHRSPRSVLWKLDKLPYGIVEAGRQWQKTAELWLLDEMCFERISSLSQLFVKRDKNGQIITIVVKVIDDFLIGGSLQVIQEFVECMKKRFELGTVVVDSPINFNGAEIVQAVTGTIELSMEQYCKRISSISLSKSRKANRDSPATRDELRQYQHLAGVLNFAGKGVLPQASFVTSYMLQNSSRLRVSHLIEANAMLKEILKLSPKLTMSAPASTTGAYLCAFSDASYNISAAQKYGQTGFVCGLAIPGPEFTAFHPLD